MPRRYKHQWIDELAFLGFFMVIGLLLEAIWK